MSEKPSPRRYRSSQEVGRCFLDYFAALGYEAIPGSSLLDDSVPMSFVMSAGMVQFERLADAARGGDHFVLIQNSFRYFDLEQVGSSSTHLSLFQMPGAFDFGPIDHCRTISQIWNLLVEVYGFDPETLFATYFCGDTIDGQFVPADAATATAWKAMGLPAERVIGYSAKQNFWTQTKDAVGRRNSRKRGPNTEVFFDRGAQYACGPRCFPGCSCGRFVEFLNTLFITHRLEDQTNQLVPLAEPFTEVVIGLERVAMILQNRESVFETDRIQPLIDQVQCFSKPIPMDPEGIELIRMERVLVDHLRALLFLVADGAPPPGKGGRARLMRILIRELLTSQRLLGISDPGFMRSMIQTALEYYPEVASARKRLLEYLSLEADRFEHTVRAGMTELEKKLSRADRGLKREDLQEMETKRGVPMPLMKYQVWQKNSHRTKNHS